MQHNSPVSEVPTLMPRQAPFDVWDFVVDYLKNKTCWNKRKQKRILLDFVLGKAKCFVTDPHTSARLSRVERFSVLSSNTCANPWRKRRQRGESLHLQNHILENNINRKAQIHVFPLVSGSPSFKELVSSPFVNNTIFILARYV